ADINTGYKVGFGTKYWFSECVAIQRLPCNILLICYLHSISIDRVTSLIRCFCSTKKRVRQRYCLYFFRQIRTYIKPQGHEFSLTRLQLLTNKTKALNFLNMWRC